MGSAGRAGAWPLRRVVVEAPATVANLGPGFDSMGMALDLWNRFELTVEDGPPCLDVTIEGEGAGELPADGTHLTVETLLGALRAHGIDAPPAVRLACRNGVPSASGLGSSSTAIVAGLVLAEAVRLSSDAGRPARAHEIDLEHVLSEAVELEGHGDNVTPAVLGGLQVVYTRGAEYRSRAIPMPPTRVVACVPRYRYLTSQARAALPKTIPHSDAVFNIGHAMLVIEALRNRDDDLLADALHDRLHERYRLPSIPGAEAARAAAYAEGAIAVCLAGAGPGLVAFSRIGHDAIGLAMVAAFAEAGLTARHWVLPVSGAGVRITVE
jgi:homoserine kinase